MNRLLVDRWLKSNELQGYEDIVNAAEKKSKIFRRDADDLLDELKRGREDVS